MAHKRRELATRASIPSIFRVGDFNFIEMNNPKIIILISL